MRILVVTAVHVPSDARILHRQIAALRGAGHDVTYVAPFVGNATTEIDPEITTIAIPRAVGRRRVRSLRGARRVLRHHGPDVDVIIIHDPELLLALLGQRSMAPVIWDVHEDLAASLVDKSWLPTWMRRAVIGVVRAAEAYGRRRCHVMLAEASYAERFGTDVPVVQNLPWLPKEPTGPDSNRVVQLGRVSALRGAHELIEVGRQLAASGMPLEVIGPVDDDVAVAIREAHERGDLIATGFVSNDRATQMLNGALAGLSLLHDVPNYRHSLPTKIAEYQAWAVPVITTPLPRAVDLVESADSGIVVPFEDVPACVAAVLALRNDPATAQAFARAGRAAAEGEHSWDRASVDFVRFVERIGSTAR